VTVLEADFDIIKSIVFTVILLQKYSHGVLAFRIHISRVLFPLHLQSIVTRNLTPYIEMFCRFLMQLCLNYKNRRISQVLS